VVPVLIKIFDLERVSGQVLEVDQDLVKRYVTDSGRHLMLKKLIEQVQMVRIGRSGKNFSFKQRLATNSSFMSSLRLNRE